MRLPLMQLIPARREVGDLLFSTVGVVVSRGAMRAVQLAQFVVLARVLGPEVFGDYGLITLAIFLFAQIGDMGLRRVIAIDLSCGRLTGAEARRFALRGGLGTAIASSLMGGIAIALLTKDVGLVDRLLAMLGIGAMSFGLMLQGLFMGSGVMRWVTALDSGPRTLGALISLALAATGLLSLQTAIAALAAGYIVVSVGAVLASRKPFGLAERLGDEQTLKARLLRGLGFALPVVFVMLNTRIGPFSLEIRDFDAAIMGALLAAMRINELLLDFASGAGLVLFTKMLASGADLARRSRTTVILVVATTLVTAAIGVALCVAAPQIVNIALGSEYRRAIPLLQIFSVFLPIAAGVKLAFNYLLASEKAASATVIILVGLVANGISLMLLPRAMGGEQVAWGVGFSYVASLAAFAVMTWGIGRIRGEKVVAAR